MGRLLCFIAVISLLCALANGGCSAGENLVIDTTGFPSCEPRPVMLDATGDENHGPLGQFSGRLRGRRLARRNMFIPEYETTRSTVSTARIIHFNITLNYIIWASATWPIDSIRSIRTYVKCPNR